MKFNYFVSLGRPGILMPQRFIQSIQFFALTLFLAFGYSTAKAQVVISEVFADGVFELRNTGNSTVNIDAYWICDFPDYRRLDQLELQCGNLNLAAGEEVVLRAEGLHETDDSELGLYSTNSFGSSDAIVSYLEWGSSSHQRSALATGKGIWDGNAIAAFTNTQSLQIGGDGLAAADWTTNDSPNACGTVAPPPPPAATSSARYRVTFDAAWSSATHPTDFPSNAHFSGLIGLTHTTNVALFELGGTASPGLINMAETGGKSPLNDEIQGVINSGQGQTLISGGGINPSPGTVSVEFDIDDAHPLVTLTSMIAPSPDWFVGVRDLNLFENGAWANSRVVEVANYDAGSDSGASFASGNQATSPQGTITMITDGPLVTNGAIPSMGTLTFTRIDAGACDATGGTLTGGPFTFCVDGEADNIPAGAITLNGNEGTNNQWVVTDEAGMILGLPGSFTGPNFDGAGAGVCFVWNLAYEDGLTGLAAGNNVSQLEGCYSLSNSVQVTRNQPAGGTLVGGPFTFCVDGQADNIPAGGITLSGNTGGNSQWVVTDEAGMILGLPGSFTGPNFDAAGVGVCFVWHLSYEDGLAGLAAGNNVSQLAGCYNLSNSVQVTRQECGDMCTANGGTLTGGPFSFCVDGQADNIPADGITLSGNTGGNSQWVVTDLDGNILGLPGSFTGPNFDGAGAGVCLVWHLSYEDGLTGLAGGNNVSQLEGCYNLSNSVEVIRQTPDGGTVSTQGGMTEFTATAGDVKVPVQFSTTATALSYWYIITDASDNILAFVNPKNTDNPDNVVLDLSGAPAGECHIWGWSYRGEGDPIPGDNISTLTDGACEAISSNFIRVIRQQAATCTANGGTLTGGPFSFCVDGQADNIPADGITLSGNSGGNSQWVVTDLDGNILGLPGSFTGPDFDGAGAGVCLVWHLSYEDGLTGLAGGNNVSQLEGCYNLSNSVEVIRQTPDGGTVSTQGGMTEFTATAGDVKVPVQFSTTATALSYWYIITDASDNILAFVNPKNTDNPDNVVLDLSGAPAGECHIWGWSYRGEGDPIPGDNISTLTDGACEAISSNFIRVIRQEAACTANGGTLTGGPFTFNSIGDGVADNIAAGSITLANNSGMNSQWVVTDNQGNILGLPPMPSAVNFDGAGSGTCLIWHLSFEDGLQGAAVGMNANDLQGCYSLSNPIEVIRNNANGCNTNGGELFGGPFTFNSIGDGVADNIPAGSITLANNSGMNSQWVVTDNQGNILGLPPMPSAVNFDGAGSGTCLIWHLSFEDGLQGAAVGMNANDLQGCYSLSNPIEVIRNNANGCNTNGGELFGGPFTFTVGDGVADNIPAGSITLANNSGMNSQWVVTDEEGKILGLPPMPSAVDFDGAGEGTCLIWHLSFEDGLQGAAVGLNANDLQGCYSLSNPVEVIREAATSDCGAPTNMVIENIDSRRTRISWDKVDGAKRYKIEIRFAGQTRVVGRGLIRSNRVFVFAPSGRDYEIRLQTLCQDGGTSAYTDWVAYSTPSSLASTGIAQSRNADVTEGLEAIEVLNEVITKIAVYPNPVRDVLSIDYQTSSNTGVLTVLHVSGKQVLVSQLAEDTNYHSVNLNHLPDGAYILTIQEEGKFPHTQRIIKGSR